MSLNTQDHATVHFLRRRLVVSTSALFHFWTLRLVTPITRGGIFANIQANVSTSNVASSHGEPLEVLDKRYGLLRCIKERWFSKVGSYCHQRALCLLGARGYDRMIKMQLISQLLLFLSYTILEFGSFN